MALILAQPDLGTSVDIVLIAAAVLYVAGLSWKWVAAGAAASVPALYLLITHVAYRQARLMAFLKPDSDPQGAGFQLLQSLIAVGSGGFTGVGLMQSKQKLFYLPEAHTDFIYAVICEELGFIGAMIVIGLFVVYGWRGLRAALPLGQFWPAVGAGDHRHGDFQTLTICRGAGHGAHEGIPLLLHQLWQVEFAGDAAGRSAVEYSRRPRDELVLCLESCDELLIAGGGTGEDFRRSPSQGVCGK